MEIYNSCILYITLNIINIDLPNLAKITIYYPNFHQNNIIHQKKHP